MGNQQNNSEIKLFGNTDSNLSTKGRSFTIMQQNPNRVDSLNVAEYNSRESKESVSTKEKAIVEDELN